MTDGPELNPVHRSASVRISAALLAVACCAVPVRAAQPQPAPPPLRTTGQSPSRPEGMVQTLPASQEVDAGSRNVAARARMLECGHQWSNMKRAGTAAGTWKDFSRGCLAQK